MKKAAYAAMIMLVPALALAQVGGEIQRVFDAGGYQQVIDATTPDAAPELVYLAAQSYQKLGASEQAVQTYDRLVQRPATDVWHAIGLSGQQLVQDQLEASAASARNAVAMAPQDATAQYQLGLVLAKQQQWVEAAAAFDAAADAQPAFAYAHYYGGLMHYRANRTDRMANHFDQFLKLAPEAPERPEVMSIMRTIRRR